MQERMRKLVEESTKRKKEKKKQKMKEKTKKGPLQPVTAMANSTGKCIMLKIGNLILIEYPVVISSLTCRKLSKTSMSQQFFKFLFI